MMFDDKKRYNFIGIGGIGMSALARILNSRGAKVCGSDRSTDTSLVADMRAEGIEVFDDHRAENVQATDILIISDAIKEDNTELLRAHELGIPIKKRADLLTLLVNEGKGIAVSGTHGKTTTSGMISEIALAADLDPTCILGGELKTIGGNARSGKSDIVIAEACEAYNSFIDLEPYIGVVNNIEPDHLDFHKTAENLYNSFAKFIRQSVISVINGDDENAKRLVSYANKPITFGKNTDNDFIISINDDYTFNLTERKSGKRYENLKINLPGTHNIYNAACAAVVALMLGVDIESIAQGLEKFPGMGRRFEKLGTYKSADVIDDYAHHPTEIFAALSGAREKYKGKIVAIFQPHLYSRTRDHLTGFAQSLKGADTLLLAPIYAARELPMEGIDHEAIKREMGEEGKGVICVKSLEEGEEIIADMDFSEGDLIITIGAGDVNRIGYALVKR